MENVKAWIWWFTMFCAPFRVSLMQRNKIDQTRWTRHFWATCMSRSKTAVMTSHLSPICIWTKIIVEGIKEKQHFLIDLLFIIVNAFDFRCNKYSRKKIVMLSSKDVRLDGCYNAFLCQKLSEKTVFVLFVFTTDKHYVHPIE